MGRFDKIFLSIVSAVAVVIFGLSIFFFVTALNNRRSWPTTNTHVTVYHCEDGTLRRLHVQQWGGGRLHVLRRNGGIYVNGERIYLTPTE